MNYIPQGNSVLDIGCGTGLWLFLLTHFKMISRGIGIDINPDKIKIANSMKTSGDNLEFLELQSENKWQEGLYDCITMIDVLHHVPTDKQKDFLTKFKKTRVKRIVFKDIDPEAKIKCFMNSIHDLLLSKRLPHYCKKEKVVEWLQEMGYGIIYVGRHDMLWYSHYLIVGEKK
ncbi:MAG: class I SAM-dependent methyltransferase [Planctomycetota bacterium]